MILKRVKTHLCVVVPRLYRMATKEAKPDGQFWLPPEAATQHMGPLPVQVRLCSSVVESNNVHFRAKHCVPAAVVGVVGAKKV